MSITSYILDECPDGVLFDLDGTLADTAPDLGAVANMLLVEEGCAPLPLSAFRPHTSSGVRGMLKTAFDLSPGEDGFERMSARFLDHYERHLCVDTRLFDDMQPLLERLEQNAIKWGVVTNKRRRFTDPLMARLGLSRRAACIISGDSAAHPKPAPDPLLLGCAQAGIRPERSIYVGDDRRDIEAGRAASMKTVAAAYGYLGIESPVAAWQADAVIESPLALLTLLPLRT